MHTRLSDILLLGIAVWLVAGTLSAGTISGFVRDQETQERLPAANVYISETDLGAMTNSSGYYVVNNIPAGEYQLICTYMGYGKLVRSIRVRPDAARVVNLKLVPQALESEAVVVETERQEDFELVETGTIHLSLRKIQTAPVMAEADLMRTLQMLPGVLTASVFSSGLYVRGGTPDQNLVLLDGMEVYNVNHLFGVFSPFDVNAIKDVKFARSGFSAQHGGRLSSVLDITNKDGNQRTLQGKTSLGLVSAKTSLQGPIGNGAFFFSGRRTYVDYMLNATEQTTTGEVQDQLRQIPDYYFFDMHLKVFQEFSHQDKLALTYYRGRDQMDFSLDPFAFSLHWENQAMNARWTHIFSDRLFSNFYISRSLYGSTLDRDDVLFTGQIFNDVKNLTVKGDLEYFPRENHTVKLGFEWKNLYAKYDARFQEQEMVLTGGGTLLATYLQDEWEVSPALNLQPGLRVTGYFPAPFQNTHEQSSYQGDPLGTIAPRLAAQYHLTDRTKIKGAFGRYYQFVNIVSMGGGGNSFMDIWFPSDHSIPPANATHYVAGIETELPGKLTWSLEGYYKDMPRLYRFDMTAVRVERGADLFHPGFGWAYGGDIYLEKRQGDFTGWVSYSLGWTQRKFARLNAGEPFYPRFDRRHSSKTVGSYRLNDRWSVNAA